MLLRMCYNCKNRTDGDKYYRCELKGIDIKEDIEDKCSNFEERDVLIELKECYDNILEALKYYCDLEERHYPIVALWIIGTYAHDEFNSYPYLYINASKGSGKSRLLRLISTLSKNGKFIQSVTEAVLFRTAKGRTFCIDEYENMANDEKGALRLLLNSAYKKGGIVERTKKISSPSGVSYGIESFDVYTSVAMANIDGMEGVLADRCIFLRLDKSYNKQITKRVENYDTNTLVQVTKTHLNGLKASLCELIQEKNLNNDWNAYIDGDLKTDDKEVIDLFKKGDETGIQSRSLELFLPLWFMAYLINKETLNKMIEVSKDIDKEKKEDSKEDKDILLLNFLSEQKSLEYRTFINLSLVYDGFKEYMGITGEWINSRWLGKALVRLKLRKGQRRMSTGIQVLLDIDKARERVENERGNRTGKEKD